MAVNRGGIIIVDSEHLNPRDVGSLCNDMDKPYTSISVSQDIAYCEARNLARPLHEQRKKASHAMQTFENDHQKSFGRLPNYQDQNAPADGKQPPMRL